MKFLSWSSGWKTYAIVAIGISTGVAQHFGYQVPSWVEWVLTFAGLGTARMAISKQSLVTANELADLVTDVLSQVTVPQTPVITLTVPPVVTPVVSTTTSPLISHTILDSHMSLNPLAPKTTLLNLPSTTFGSVSDR